MVRFMSRLPLKIKEKALSLRLQGYSVKEIADKLHIAKSTSSLWVRNIKLNKKAQIRLKKRNLLGYYKTSLRWQKKRAREEQEYRSIALKVINRLKKDSNYFKVYCALFYWCEGSKNTKHGVRFVNSDAALVKTFLTIFRKSFKLDEAKFRVLMHLHEYHNEEKQKFFWSNLTKIPKNQFNRSFLKPHTKKRIRDNYPGCIAVYYNDCRVARELWAIYRVFSKQVGTW